MPTKTILNIEDNIFKHMAIKRALERCGIHSVTHKNNAEDGISEIERAIASGHPYDLLVLDMHFPVNGENRFDAGEWVMEKLKEKGISIPIIICSSVRYRFPEAAACIFYNERSGDIDADMREALKAVELL